MTHTEKVQEMVSLYLETPASFPLVRSDTEKNALVLVFLKAERRKYLSEPEQPTFFGELR